MATVLEPTAPIVTVHYESGVNTTLHIPDDAYTLAGFRRWVHSNAFPEKQPVMFLNGEIYLFMPKEDIFTHAAVKTSVAGTVFNLNQENDLGNFYINGVLVTNVEADISNNPDMIGLLWESLESDKVRYITNKKGRSVEIEGSADWLLEIVSNGSVKKDKITLREAYHKAGVREYWIIDVRGEEIDFQILNWRKTGYVAASHKSGWQRSRIFDRSFQLTRSRDRRGAWRYALAVKGE
jgi:Uma2 family endonuclease